MVNHHTADHESLSTADDRCPLPDPLPAAAAALGPRRMTQIVWGFLLLGIAVRCVRYLLRFPLWPDEAFLAHNYLDRGYWELLQPLDYHQVAPWLYLWIQRALLSVFGFTEYSLRLYALVCGIGSLLLFRYWASRLLRGTAFVLAVATFAVGYPLIRYSAEAKPYGSDALASLALLALTVEVWRHPGDRRWWWALTLAMPVAVMLSYPAMFTAGGISLGLAAALGRRGSRGDWLYWVITNTVLCASVAALFVASAASQMSSVGADMRAAWSQSFPPLTSPGKLALFLLVSHTSDALAYPLGGARGASTLTSLCCLAALVLLVRARRFPLATLCLAPLTLNFAAAMMHCYPYGTHVRFLLYMGPTFCLLTGLGAAQLVAALKPRRWSPASGVLSILVVFTLIGVGCPVRDFLKPYKETCWMRNRDLARWFWTDKAIDAELVCLRNDCGRCFCTPAEGDPLASVYYCNQRIYSPRHARREPAHLERVSASRPLRCVRFRPDCTTERDEAAFRQWLDDMQADYRLIAQEKYPMSFYVYAELIAVDPIEVYDFIPKGTPRASTALLQAPLPARATSLIR